MSNETRLRQFPLDRLKLSANGKWGDPADLIAGASNNSSGVYSPDDADAAAWWQAAQSIGEKQSPECTHDWKIYDSGFTRFEYCSKCNLEKSE
ncbi:MAG: hypothetical protein ACAH17_03505 [Candidatus Paceibacterota bacterium]